MKILHCIIQYLPNHVAGTEVYTHTIALYQQSQGHQVAIAVPYIQHYATNEFQPHYTFENIDVYSFKETANPTDRNIFTGKKKPEGVANFLQLLQQLEPDVIHFQELNRSIGFTVEHVKVAKQLGAKVIITMHLSFYTCNTNKLIYNNQLCSGVINQFKCAACSYQSKFNVNKNIAKVLAYLSIIVKKIGVLNVLPPSKITSLLSMPLYVQRIKNELKLLTANTHKIVVLTEWYKNVLLSNEVPINNIALIPQAIATLAPIPTFANKVSINIPIKLIFIGRVQHIKGVHLLIEALKNFTEQQIILDIYGKVETTSYYTACKQLSAAMPHVRWKGMLKRTAVIPTIAEYHLLCLPSLFSEMSPLVIQEAFAANTPVLASSVYGNMEQIKEGINGILVDFNSSKSIINTLQKLIGNPESIICMSKQIVAANNFENTGKQYMQLYQTC